MEKLNHLDKLKKVLEKKIETIKTSCQEVPVIITLAKSPSGFKLL